MNTLLSFIPPTVVVACITAIGTYFASTKNSQTTMETLYTTEIQKIIAEYNFQIGELRQEIHFLRRENQELHTLIAKLQSSRKNRT
ncbi:hypothetical protein MFLO_14312 [Listeria floridensis FSL S10-1187]|uniref:Uncharacterized protein n=1 Tax=Listeria floridensis FSL S10-1187 TaxID=1265817 RepID=A0ABN0RBX0_9LIST|nr:hypothetical protein [Listeria floridensis]EUJ26135.1 hypothetical protein MFLO_14312 [Listeria floridensis FSL S10-1187]